MVGGVVASWVLMCRRTIPRGLADFEQVMTGLGGTVRHTVRSTYPHVWHTLVRVL